MVCLAVAIHFDIETCSWGFCWSQDFQNDFSSFYTRHWSNFGKRISHTIPTCVLVNPDGKSLHDFGADAQTQYAVLEREDRHKPYYFFKEISKKLIKSFREESEEQVFIKDEMGKPLPALTVFSLALQFLKHDINQQFKKVHLDIDDNIYVVLTVPDEFQAVGAIDFMRKAASEAEFNAKTLSVVTEVDAVSVYCQHASFQAFTKERMFKCTKGMKYMLVNAGGCSTNIAVHEMVQMGLVKEFTVVSIHKGGFSMVLDAFEDFCQNLFGMNIFDKFKTTSEEDWLDMKDEFEIKTRCFRPNDISPVRIYCPSMMNDLYEEETNKKLKDAIKTSEDIHWFANKIEINSRLFCTFISPAVEQAVSNIRSALIKPAVAGIVVCGKLTALPMFRDALLSSFHDNQVMFVQAETMAALKGPVIIGLGLGCIEKIERVHNAEIVAAIDFGTTYSGWAYSLRTDFKLDPTKGHLQSWNSGFSETAKTPTCILIRPDGETVENFGYDAEDKYRDLTESGEHMNYYYFRRFKMLLNRKLGENLTRSITIEDEMNRSLPALDVFAMSIRFLKDDLFGAVQKGIVGGVRKQDINWVLTVPAIWTDGAKQFMREAAIKAGIERKRITIALEPEAASLYCRHLSVEATVSNTGVSISSLKAGTRYMVLDAGGGTIDITVHEVDTCNGVKEVHAACGGGWGGTTVDKEFENLLMDLLTEDVYLQFKLENTDDWCYLWREFEMQKRAITAKSNKPVRMRLPKSLYEISCLADSISGSRFASEIDLVKDKIKFSSKISKSWFNISVDKTIDLVLNILSTVKDITAILMVGGFSESSVLQDAVTSAINDVQIVIPREASFPILKGALIFGHLPKFVTERVLRYTYGVGSFCAFVEGKHQERRRLKTDVGDVCRNIFSKHVEINQRVKVGEPQVWHSYHPQFRSQTQMDISIYASEKPSPMYTDQNCVFVGKMLVDIADHNNAVDKEVLVALTFSGTEIVVEAKNKKTGKKQCAAIDFLG